MFIIVIAPHSISKTINLYYKTEGKKFCTKFKYVHNVYTVCPRNLYPFCIVSLLGHAVILGKTIITNPTTTIIISITTT